MMFNLFLRFAITPSSFSCRVDLLVYLVLVIISTTTSSFANPTYDHVVVVVEENHGYNEIIGSTNAAYINTVLATGGVVLTNAYGEQHPSQPNYYWLFSGSNQGISNDTPPVAPAFGTPNLYIALESHFSQTAQSNNFFGGYVDGYPGAANAYSTNANVNYAERHVPWLGFNNINGGDPAGMTRDFSSTFPTNAAGFNNLPVISFVIPALNNDMHDYDTNGNAVFNPSNSAVAIRNGDNWLSNNLSSYAAWAKSNNSLLIVTWDEDSTADWPTPTNPGVNPSGLTAPNLAYQQSTNTSGPNQIPMIFFGANLATNGLVGADGLNSNGVNNINLLRTLESFYGLSPSGDQTPLAQSAGMSDVAVTNIFAVPEPSPPLLLGVGLAIFACARFVAFVRPFL